MNNRLTEAQLSQIVDEVQRLSQRRNDEFEPKQVKEILQELNLPPELLDEALVQLSRREALAIQQRRNRWIIAGAITSLVIVLAGTTFFVQQNQQAIARISTVQSQITLTQDSSSNLAEVNRQTNPLIYYRVTLKDAPIGKNLSLSCDWIAPSGSIIHQNRWQTKTIDKTVWPTHCRYQFNSGATPGNWKVQMSVGDRILSTTSFIVK